MQLSKSNHFKDWYANSPNKPFSSLCFVSSATSKEALVSAIFVTFVSVMNSSVTVTNSSHGWCQQCLFRNGWYRVFMRMIKSARDCQRCIRQVARLPVVPHWDVSKQSTEFPPAHLSVTGFGGMNWKPGSKSKEYFKVAKSFLYAFRQALYKAAHSTNLLSRMGGEGFLFQTTLVFCVGVVRYLNVFRRKSEVCQLQTAKAVIWAINSN